MQRDGAAVDACVLEPELARRLEEVLVDALAAAYRRAEQRDLLAAELALDARHDLLAAERAERLVAGRAVLHADLGVEQAQVVIDLGDGGDGRLAAAAAQTLLARPARRARVAQRRG